MEKKKTILSTLFAVLTLLISVVGATFAYFSVNSTSSNANSLVSTKAGAVGAVSMTEGISNFYLNVSAEQMSKSASMPSIEGGVGIIHYYAQPTNIQSTDVEPSPLVVAYLEASNIENEEIIYNCTFDYTIMPIDISDAEAMEVLKKDSFLELYIIHDDGLIQKQYNLGEIQKSSVSVNIKDGHIYSISLLAGLSNKNEYAQNAIAGKSLQTNISFENFKCVVR